MPISSSIQTTINDTTKNNYYFDSLNELIGYFQSQRGLVTHRTPSSLEEQENQKPKNQEHAQLVVTHDFKGGYYEDPHKRTYSFEWLSSVDIFVYFSHHRISIPPIQWITAAKTHHTRVLGTLIFENESFRDLQFLLSGPQLDASRQPDPATKYYINLTNTPISTYFADRLIDLAIHHQFHGWLINIEIDVLKALRDPVLVRLCVHAIKVWVEYLRKQGQIRVGSDWEVSWYDSVSYYNGSLSWQSQLRPQHNLNFFAASSSIFLDYHWSAQHLRATQHFIDQFFDLHRSPDLYPRETLAELSQSFQPSMDIKVATHQLRRSVLHGVDVFGRGCPYGGGFSSWKAAHDILNAKFSVALFAPGWTWESDILKQDRIGLEESGTRWWDLWWRDERYFWVGLTRDAAAGEDQKPKGLNQSLISIEPPNAYIDSLRIARETKQPQPRRGAGYSELPQHKPLLELFAVRHKRTSTSFYTNWSLGSGHGIWVQGEHHFDPLHGIGEWTDMAMSFPKHDLSIRGGSIWSARDDDTIVQTGVARCEIVENVGWFGSGCVQIEEQANDQASNGTVKCLWMNTTSVSCASGIECRLVWKPIDPKAISMAPLGVALRTNAPITQTGEKKDTPISGHEADASPGPLEANFSVWPTTNSGLETCNTKTCELENGWFESTCLLKNKSTSSSLMIDRIGITTLPATRFSHYVGEISLVPSSQSAGSVEKTHDQPPLEVIWLADATHEPIEVDSTIQNDRSRNIRMPGKIKWQYPSRSGSPETSKNRHQDVLAWLIYVSNDGGIDCNIPNHKQLNQRLIGVVKGFQEFNLCGFMAPLSHENTADNRSSNHQVNEKWTILIHGIGLHGKIISNGSCLLTHSL
ncbi:hypothetical protein MJO28_006838 [Puccinia striiformis f. sp. tritici]|uniref:Uncharacterized protein n=1 Tax=Puccinia striiformis f. sp. tritici TaxID=168172 RepID=A0ACC0EK47_9BASI|nr:hypothetical protein MJO28_006838 [Puccinia striiformis f. sp. tritici]